MATFEQILFGSEYLSNVQKFYGWSEELARYSLGSMANSMEQLQDWRVDAIMQKDREHSLDLTTGGQALEVGFGTGSFTVTARRRGINITGIDYTVGYMRVARSLGSLAGFPEDQLYSIFRQGNVEDLQFPSDHFGLILSSGVMQFVGDLVSAMREMLRTLKPGGIVLLDSPDYRFPFEAQYNIPWIPFMKKEQAKAWLEGFERPVKGLDYIKYISLPHIVGIMKAVGFEILEAGTLVPESEIPRQIHEILGPEPLDRIIDDPARVYLLARRLKREGVVSHGAAFKITARKPLAQR